MNAGHDNTMIAIHESALSKIADVLITLQDETIKRMSDAVEAAETRIAELQIKVNTFRAERDAADTLRIEAEARAAQAVDDLDKRDDVIRGLSNRLTEVFNQLEKAEQERDEFQAERDAFAAENDAIHRAINEMCGTDTSTVEAVQHVIEQRDELRTKLNEALAIARGFVAERDELRRQLEQAQRDFEKYRDDLFATMAGAK